MGSKRFVLSIVLLCLLLGGIQAQSNIDQAKAVYIYNFLSHIMWQENPNEEKIVIGVIGDSKIYEHLIAYTQNRNVGAKSIDVRRIDADSEVLNCHVVFVPQNESSMVEKVAKIAKNKSCLVIGDDIAMNDYGATISFIHQGSKLKYKLSQENAAAHKLIVSKALKSMSL